MLLCRTEGQYQNQYRPWGRVSEQIHPHESYIRVGVGRGALKTSSGEREILEELLNSVLLLFFK